ncbi:MAG: hypothetical protein HGA70_06075 [Chlorobiaceae bacterium]|nr:hypothetical protein [Chlorobiaceae bacterium]NTW09779.1 hypothetical protein [Chlorobiaceae bacterium]
MKKNTGVWIDHREALVVSMEGDETIVLHIESGAESHFKPSGGWKASGTAVAQSVSNEHTDEERRKHQYHAFYQNVIKLLGDSDAVVIFGAGEAKTELAKEMEKAGIFQDKVRGVETCNRVTENQFIAKVKDFF